VEDVGGESDAPAPDDDEELTDEDRAAIEAIPVVEDELVSELDRPDTPGAIYLEEALLYRPISTGDVFCDAPVPGTQKPDAMHNLTLLLSHPSAMRRGADLEAQLRGAPIGLRDGLSAKRWAKNRLDVFPLPRFTDVAAANGFKIPADKWAALIELAGPVDSNVLDVEKRVACLSPVGVRLLLQTIVAVDTRCIVNPVLIERQIDQKLEEVEWLQDWNEALVEPLGLEGADLTGALAHAARQFEEVMTKTGDGRERSLRECLYAREEVREAKRALADEITARRQALN
jgi:hypothetical protein